MSHPLSRSDSGLPLIIVPDASPVPTVTAKRLTTLTAKMALSRLTEAVRICDEISESSIRTQVRRIGEKDVTFAWKISFNYEEGMNEISVTYGPWWAAMDPNPNLPEGTIGVVPMKEVVALSNKINEYLNSLGDDKEWPNTLEEMGL